MHSWFDKISIDKVPKHIAIIMDGNGRWAKAKGEERIYGHFAGVESVRKVLKGATEIGVEYLTLYAFSSENWNRPKEEVDALMDLLVRTISEEVESLNENGVRLKAIGNLDSLPGDCNVVLQKAIERTSKNDKITLVLALSYGSREELTCAFKKMISDYDSDKLTLEEITEDKISSYLSTKSIPDPELLIRTSGENRVSNFLLWQIAYTEFYFSEKFWPEFTREDLYEAIVYFQNRERRFGKISEQLTEEK